MPKTRFRQCKTTGQSVGDVLETGFFSILLGTSLLTPDRADDVVGNVVCVLVFPEPQHCPACRSQLLVGVEVPLRVGGDLRAPEVVVALQRTR